ncbi:MAG: hypothetical protein FJW68_08560 [Actinobacteria bacterium]|nr:hypothetical protein [Actinomycetota bacterium]
MNFKQEIINTICGKKVSHLPFIPRLDIWYKANKFRNTLPRKYKDATLNEIVDDIGLGYHTVVPDFSNLRTGESIAFLGLGVYDLKTNPYKIDFSGLDFKFTTNENGVTETTFKTPYGNIKTTTVYNDAMLKSGATIGHTTEHALKNINDIEAMIYIFENMAVKDNYSDFRQYRRSIGDNGVCVAFSMLSGSPFHHIMKELIPFEQFVYTFNDSLPYLEELSGAISVFFDKILNIAAMSDSEILFCGANYDSFLTWPAFFNKYITPFLKKYSKLAHKNNKFFLTHTDGENENLINEYIESGIDVADSICPFPMTKLKLPGIRKDFGEKITIWGGLPSICILEEYMNDYEFDKYIHELLQSLGKGDHIILSFADTTPPDGKFERILKVNKLAKSFKV